MVIFTRVNFQLINHDQALIELHPKRRTASGWSQVNQGLPYVNSGWPSYKLILRLCHNQSKPSRVAPDSTSSSFSIAATIWYLFHLIIGQFRIDRSHFVWEQLNFVEFLLHGWKISLLKFVSADFQRPGQPLLCIRLIYRESPVLLDFNIDLQRLIWLLGKVLPDVQALENKIIFFSKKLPHFPFCVFVAKKISIIKNRVLPAKIILFSAQISSCAWPRSE